VVLLIYLRFLSFTRRCWPLEYRGHFGHYCGRLRPIRGGLFIVCWITDAKRKTGQQLSSLSLLQLSLPGMH
jgi:hypothetical protein